MPFANLVIIKHGTVSVFSLTWGRPSSEWIRCRRWRRSRCDAGWSTSPGLYRPSCSASGWAASWRGRTAFRTTSPPRWWSRWCARARWCRRETRKRRTGRRSRSCRKSSLDARPGHEKDSLEFKSFRVQYILGRANGVMDSTLACCSGGPGLIPAISKSIKLQYSDVFSSLSA